MSILNSRSLTIILASATVTLLSLHQTTANYGKEFLVALPYLDLPQANALFHMVPYNFSNVVSLKWTKSSNNVQDAFEMAIIEGEYFSTTKFSLSSSQSAVYISANDSVVVLVTLILGAEAGSSIGTFLASPLGEQLLLTRYIIITQCEINQCILLIASAYDNTGVLIKLNITPSNGVLTYNGELYYNEDILNLNLGAFQTVQIDYGTVDLTGSILTSTLQPVQVILGGDFVLSGNAGVSDVLLEEILPESLLGTQFILINSIIKDVACTTIKVAYAQTNTKLTFNPSSLTVVSNNSNWISFTFKQSSTFLSSDKPVVVEVHFGNIASTNPVSVASVLVAPISMWASRYVMIMWTGTLALATTQGCASKIVLNNGAVTSWAKVSDQPKYTFAIVQISGYGKYVLEGHGGCRVGGYVTYLNGEAFTAYQIGWRLDQLQPPILPSTLDIMSTPVELTTIEPFVETTFLTISSSFSDAMIAISAFPTLLTESTTIEYKISTPSQTESMTTDYTKSTPLLTPVQLSTDEIVSSPSPITTVSFVSSTSIVDSDKPVTSTPKTNSINTQSKFAKNSGSYSDNKENFHVSNKATSKDSPTDSNNATSVATIAHTNINTSILTANLTQTSLATQASTDKMSATNISTERLDTSGPSTHGQMNESSTRGQFSTAYSIESSRPSTNEQIGSESSTSGHFTSDSLADGHITTTAIADRHIITDSSTDRHVSYGSSKDEQTIPEFSIDEEIIIWSSTYEKTTTGSSKDIQNTTGSLKDGQNTTGSSRDGQTTTETLASTKTRTEVPADINITNETFTNNRTKESVSLLGTNMTVACACLCTTKYFSNLTVNSTPFQNILTLIQKELYLSKKNLIKYKMTKTSLENVELNAKYIGSTLGLIIVTLIFGFLFSFDIMKLFCKHIENI